MNSILIGDWDLEYTPSLIIREEDWGSYLTRDYDLRKIEDYIDMIKWSRYGKIDYLGAGSESKFFKGKRAYEVTLKDEGFFEGYQIAHIHEYDIKTGEPRMVFFANSSWNGNYSEEEEDEIIQEDDN